MHLDNSFNSTKEKNIDAPEPLTAAAVFENMGNSTLRNPTASSTNINLPELTLVDLNEAKIRSEQNDLRFSNVVPHAQESSPQLPESKIVGRDPRYKEVKEGFKNAKESTKGWDSSEPPSVDNIKERIGDSRVLFWGDDHADKDSPTRFSKALESLKTAGVDAVAMEGFREDQQPLVNQWLAAEKGSDAEKRLEGQVRENVHRAINDTKDFEDKMMEVMRASKDAGMKVLCIEPNGVKMTTDGDGDDGHPPGDRNENWTRVTQKYLTDHPDSKIVAFGGAGHFIHLPEDDTFADLIAKSPFTPTDITPPAEYVEPK
jgi:hypothetical protein